MGTHALGVSNVIVLDSNALAAANSKTITGFVSGTDDIQLTSGTTTLNGLTLAAGNTAATMLAPVTDATSVAALSNVYTALATSTGLDGSAGHEFAASAAGTGTIVARTVVYTTGAAAGTYLVINDSVAGFQAANDIVIKLVGNTTFAAGDIVVV
jgi:S-layer protein